MRKPEEQEIRWAHAWDVAERYLSAERARRLATMSDDDARQAIVRIFSGPMPMPHDRGTGLIERQRLFRELR